MAVATPAVLEELDAAPPTEEDRYGIYVREGGRPREIATTSKDGIGATLVQFHEDRREAGDPACPVFGILDRVERRWIASLWHPKENS